MATHRKLPRFAGIVVLLAGALALGACSGDSGGSGGDPNSYRFEGATSIGKVIPPSERKPAPKVSAKLLDGSGSMSLAQHKGKPTVLAFWASWCPPCRVEMPQLSGLNTELAGKVNFVGVDSRDQSGDAKAFVRDNKISFASVVDSDGALPQKLGNVRAGLPFTVVMDKSGKVAAVYIARYGAKDLDGALSTLLKES